MVSSVVLGSVVSSFVASRSASITGDDVHVDVDVSVTVVVVDEAVSVAVVVLVTVAVAADREESKPNPPAVVEWKVFETELCTVAVASGVKVGFVFKLLCETLWGSHSLLLLGILAKGCLSIPLASTRIRI
jgi:hypothetical protein